MVTGVSPHENTNSSFLLKELVLLTMIREYRKIMFVFFVLVMTALKIRAQYFAHDLTIHTWLSTKGLVTSNLFDWIWNFSNDHVNFVMKEKDTGKVVSDFNYKYYLVPRSTDVTHFDTSRVGKDTFGKFIILERKKGESTGVGADYHLVEIVSYDENALVLFYDRRARLYFKPLQ